VPRLAANLSFLFREVPVHGRIEAAARAGFRGVEIPFPYGLDRRRTVEALKAHDLAVVLINAPAGDFQSGERGLACLPGRSGEFQEAVASAIEWAGALGCSCVHVMAGIAPPGSDPGLLHRTYVDNLRFAASELGRRGLKLLVEAINPRDIPGYFLTTPRRATEIISEVGSPHLFLQYDIYHAQVTEGDLAPSIERYLPRIAHLQLADTPGRHEPGTGEINYRFLLDFIDRLGYQGWVGCEYEPAADTISGLGWASGYLESR
jgi:hydroxypyruvate isomerase